MIRRINEWLIVLAPWLEMRNLATKNVLSVVLLLTAGLLLPGCSSVQVHPWTRTKPLTEQPAYVPVNKLSFVKTEFREEAAALLRKEDATALSPADLARFAETPPTMSPGETAFLVRGVSWNIPPLFALVYSERAGTILHVKQYEYNGEIYIPQMNRSEANPLIVLLPQKPLEVYPNAVDGGDSVMRMGSAYPVLWSK